MIRTPPAYPQRPHPAPRPGRRRESSAEVADDVVADEAAGEPGVAVVVRHANVELVRAVVLVELGVVDVLRVEGALEPGVVGRRPARRAHQIADEVVVAVGAGAAVVPPQRGVVTVTAAGDDLPRVLLR